MDSTNESHDARHFERWSQNYERSWMQRLLFTRVHRAVLDLAATFPPPATVLDVGCGTGRLLRAAAARWPGAQLLGVDPVVGMVDVARRLTPSATILRGLAEDLPLPDASVDLALSTMSFHHWHHQVASARELTRVLRPGGHVILADLAPPRALDWLLRHGQGALPAGERRQTLTAAGLRIERQLGIVYPLILATIATREA